MRRWVAVWLVWVILAPMAFAERTWTERYVDCENGSDASDGTTEGNAWLTVQKCLDTATAGMRCNIEWDGASQTCTLGATVDVDTNAGTDDDPIMVQGYSATVGDGTYAIIDGASTAVNVFSCTVANIIFRHLELKGSTGDAFTSSGLCDDTIVTEMKITSAGAEGINNSAGNGTFAVFGTEIGNTTTTGYDDNTVSQETLFNYIHDTGGAGITADAGGSKIAFNVIDTTAGSNISCTNSHCVIVGNTLYNATGAGNDNITIASADHRHVILNNILNTAADYNLDINTGDEVRVWGGNAWAGGTTGTVDDAALISVDLQAAQTDSPGFTNAGGGDFSLGANLDDDGYPATHLGSATTSHLEPGASMYEETAGAAGGAWGF